MATSNFGLNQPAMSDKVADTIPALARNFAIIDTLMPVGYILITTRTTFNPNMQYPGTSWTQLHGVFLVASGEGFSAGSTGGKSEHYHKIPIGFDGETVFYHHDSAGIPAYGSETLIDKVYTEAVQWKTAGDLRESWSGKSSNLPPYKAVNMWERTA